jgi:Sulfotransferase family
MHPPLILLSPPRSFSSVVSTMIGQHPQLYGFPELHLFSTETLGEILERKAQSGKVAAPGLIRTLAQEHDGVQTSRTALRAIEWLRERHDWTTQQLFNYLLELVSPRIGVEKSPQTSRKARYLERAYTWFPDAYYLHLTRHPISSRKSIQEFFENKDAKSQDSEGKLTKSSALDGLMVWYQMHLNILSFTKTLPASQTLRIKGEDLLSDSDRYLPQIAEWMGLRTDSEVVEAMKHPENSPYAYTGPAPVPGGNDPKFMRNPRLRGGTVREPSLARFFETTDWQFAPSAVKALIEEGGIDFPSEEYFKSEITQLAHLMGYE